MVAFNEDVADLFAGRDVPDLAIGPAIKPQSAHIQRRYSPTALDSPPLELEPSHIDLLRQKEQLERELLREKKKAEIRWKQEEHEQKLRLEKQREIETRRRRERERELQFKQNLAFADKAKQRLDRKQREMRVDDDRKRKESNSKS